MPPRVKITKDDIINAMVQLVRENGEEGINARTVAARLNCSTQPIFSNFCSMEELRLAVIEKANELCEEYMKKESESGKFPIYKANGMGYIRFAKEERELFKLLYMRDRTEESIPTEMKITDDMQKIIQKNTGLSGENLQLFHLEMWAYVHGIASMFATGFVNLDWELVSKMLTDAYLGLKKQYETE